MNHFKNFDIDFLLNLYGDNVIASLTDTKGIIKYVSDAYVEISEYSREELIGQPQNIVRHPDMPSSIFKELWETISSGKTWKGEIKNLKKHNDFYWVKATITAQRDDNGKIIGYASVRQDITDKKKAIKLHNQIQNMLDNIEDGFLIFDQNFKIMESYSKNCLNILQQENIYNKNIADVLFDNDKELKETFIFGCEQLFQTQCTDTKDIYLSLLPQKHYNHKVQYTIHYKILSDGNFLILLRDITNQTELEQKIKHEQKMQKMCITIATHKEESVELIQSFITFLKSDFQNINDDKLKMDLHTFKGLFAQLEMIHTIEAIHSIETLIKHTKFTHHNRRDLKDAFHQDIKMIADIFGHQFLSPITFVKVELEHINKIITDMQDFIETKSDNRYMLGEILDSLKHMKDQSFYNMLKVHQISIYDFAKKSNKLLYPLEIIGAKDLLVDEKFKNFTKSLVHIFSNSIVHGIEDADTRIKFNKNEKGKIVCSFDSVGNNILLKISDDGEGIDTNNIIAKALELGLVEKEKIDTLDNQEILQFIFSNEFSMSGELTELSGRGVGLASVKYELSRLYGKVHIENNRFEGLSFLFTIPYKEDIDNDSVLIGNAIIDTTRNFLQKDLNIETANIFSMDKFNTKNCYSTIQLTGFSNVVFSIFMDDKLVDKTLEFFFQGEEIQNEDKLKKSLSAEVLNILVGLSVPKFPSDYTQLTLGVPTVLDNFILETFIENNESKLIRVETEYGNLELSIIVLEKTN